MDSALGRIPVAHWSTSSLALSPKAPEYEPGGIMFRTAAMVSLASVSMNTPDTFKQVPSLMYITFILDLMVALLFTIEMISKMYIEGIIAPASSQVSCPSKTHTLFSFLLLFYFISFLVFLVLHNTLSCSFF
ncbi:unnamed protein product [Trichobilharzia regenti]|nr:unnamed protein product [Trichobilharzia regenti]